MQFSIGRGKEESQGEEYDTIGFEPVTGSAIEEWLARGPGSGRLAAGFLAE
jgi:hypothetical protein